MGVTIDAPTGLKLLWTPTDKLGNVRGYIDATGALTAMLDYDPWGKRRNPSGIGTPDSLDDSVDNKGFTGHEMLDNLDLVHMNGRIYDPLIGRFLTADPEVQSPENSQSYNRYTYVWNNPTNLTDPTGFDAEKGGCEDESKCASQKLREATREFTRTSGGALPAFFGYSFFRGAVSNGNVNSGPSGENKSKNESPPASQSKEAKEGGSAPSTGPDIWNVRHRTEIFAVPQSRGFAFTAVDVGTGQWLSGEFNTTTTTNTNDLEPGNYTISPRPHVEVKEGLAGLKQEIGSLMSGNREGDVNKHEGQPLITNIGEPGAVRHSDGSISRGITIHPGRDANGNGGMSLGCMVCNTATFNKLNQLLTQSYDFGGAYLHVLPPPTTK